MLELPPIIHPRISEYIAHESERLFELIDAFGSALHMVFPEIVRDNAGRYRRVFDEKSVNGKMFYAMKANKSEAILEVVASADGGADVSSLYELRRALSHGIKGHNINVSGPMKKPRLLLLAIQHDSVISVDSIEDIHHIIQISRLLLSDQKVRILFRLNDVGTKNSRFGIPRSDLSNAYEMLRTEGTKIELQGFAFHLDGYSQEERVKAIEKIIPEIQRARSLGFPCNIIDIGGGFTVSYIDQSTWEKFQREHESNASESIFFNGKRFSGFYPYYNEYPNEDFLKCILESEILDTRKSITEVLRNEDIKLWIEPGRSLLDQAGVTLMRVKGIKRTANGENIVEVEANINNLSEQWFNTEFLPGPILIQREQDDSEDDFNASVGGNTCMEMDMVTWRKIGFKHIPRAGDILIYVNTAGYQMDTNESEFHLLPIPEKVAVYQNRGQWRWKRDSQFSLLDLNS